MKILINIVLLFTLCLGVTLLSCYSNDTRPNIIVINVQGLSLKNNSKISLSSPNLTRIKSEGITFNRFYKSSPTNSLNDYSILTGKYYTSTLSKNTTKANKTDKRNTRLKKIDEVVATIEKSNYSTKIIGNWELYNSFSLSKKDSNIRQSNIASLSFDNVDISNIYDPVKAILFDRSFEKAIEFVAKNRKFPFCLFLKTNGSSQFTEAAKGKNINKNQTNYNLSEFDNKIGELLKTLEENDILDNTILVITCNNAVTEKNSIYEKQVNIPTIFMWKDNYNGGRISNQLVSSIDIVPTLFELCDIKHITTNNFDGISWDSILERNNKSERDALFIDGFFSKSVVTINWKYISTRDHDDNYHLEN